MISIKLSGGLGNNMFEYAAAKSLSKKKNLRLCYFTQKNRSYYFRKLFKFFLSFLFGKKEKFQKQISNKDLTQYFNLEENQFKLLIYRFAWNLKSRKFKKIFKYNNLNLFDKKNLYNLDDFVQDFYNCSDWTELSGGFFSEKFFFNRKLIINCFKPNYKYQKKIDLIENTFKESYDKRCCIHIRRGDALFMDKGFDYKGYGWGLPKNYYKYLIEKIGLDFLFIFVSDDPEWVERNFSYLPNKIFLKNNEEIVDMFILSKCKYNILSRSTFSWWGAWLNQCPNKKIYAPKFFIGINKRICYPYGLDEGDEVSKWNYIDVDNIRN
jgi:hypothetical protein